MASLSSIRLLRKQWGAEKKKPKAVAYLFEHPETQQQVARAVQAYAERHFYKATTITTTKQNILGRCDAALAS